MDKSAKAPKQQAGYITAEASSAGKLSRKKSWWGGRNLERPAYSIFSFLIISSEESVWGEEMSWSGLCYKGYPSEEKQGQEMWSRSFWSLRDVLVCADWLKQNTWDWVIYKEQKYIGLQFCRLGSPRLREGLFTKGEKGRGGNWGGGRKHEGNQGETKN